MRKNVMDSLGGLQRFGVYIAEDFFIAKAYTDANWKIRVASQPAMQNSATYSVPIWQKRMIRWCKLRLRISIASWLEPMSDCFLAGLWSSWSVNFFFGWNSLVFFLIHVLAWFLCDYMLLKTCQAGKLPFTKYEYIIAWLYRESVCFYLFIKAASNPNVKWREGKYRLKWGSRADKIEDNNNKQSKEVNIEAGSIDASSVNVNNLSSAITTTTTTTNTTTPVTTTNTTTNSNPTAYTLPELTHSKHKNQHKRTNSYSVIHKSSQHGNHGNQSSHHNNNNNYSNSDLESNSYTPFLNSSSTSSKTTPFNYVRTHQHHHSISSPFVFNNNNQSAQIFTNVPLTLPTSIATATTNNSNTK
jgi:hypothetical protein